MASHKFISSSTHAPTSKRHSSMNEKSSFPPHTSSYSDPSVRTFQRKGSLPLLQSVSDNVVYVSPHYSAQDLPPTPSSPGKLVQKYMEHIDVQPGQRKQLRGTLSQDQIPASSVYQELPGSAQSLKATALVAPYVGDSSYKIPTSRFDDLEGTISAVQRGKPIMAESSHAGSASEKWKTLVETKDNLLSQKNRLIDRQKATISHLQAQLQSMEAQSSAQLVTSMRATADSTLSTRLRELECKNAALQAELTSLQSVQRRENEQLSHKLDANEYELHKKTVDFSKRQEELLTESEQLQKQVSDKTLSLKELEHKLHVCQDKNKELSQHIVKLNSYFDNMPTMEEYLALKEHTQHQDKLCSSLTSQLAHKDEQLNTALAKLREQETSCADLERTCTDLKQQLESARGSDAEASRLQEEKARAMAECARLQKMLFGADKRCQRELEAMRQRHKARFQEATADLRVKHKAVVKRMKMLETQLLRNSDTMLAVNEELQLNQGTVTELKSSMKELLTQNQQLVEKNITLQEKGDKEVTEGPSVRAQQLAIELTHCVKDFRSLIDLSSSLMEEKFTSPHLFGNPESDDDGRALASETDLAFTEGYDALLEQSRRLKRDIESLREFVSEQLAIQVSTACHVQ